MNPGNQTSQVLHPGRQSEGVLQGSELVVGVEKYGVSDGIARGESRTESWFRLLFVVANPRWYIAEIRSGGMVPSEVALVSSLLLAYSARRTGAMGLQYLDPLSEDTSIGARLLLTSSRSVQVLLPTERLPSFSESVDSTCESDDLDSLADPPQSVADKE